MAFRWHKLPQLNATDASRTQKQSQLRKFIKSKDSILSQSVNILNTSHITFPQSCQRSNFFSVPLSVHSCLSLILWVQHWNMHNNKQILHAALGTLLQNTNLCEKIVLTSNTWWAPLMTWEVPLFITQQSIHQLLPCLPWKRAKLRVTATGPQERVEGG